MKYTVALKRCETYELESVKKALEECIESLGGLAPYIAAGEKVLLKVNLLMRKQPNEAVTTHPVFVQALAELLISHGAKVIIGDSPGGPFNDTIVKPIYKSAGMEDVARITGAALNANYRSFEKKNPQGRMLKKLIQTDMLNDVDKVISVSKLKTHGMMTFTGAVKNMFGTIPGVLKAEYHINMPEKNDFADALVDICLSANPVLSFMDGIVGMEGDGPSAGTPRKLNAVLVSDSPFHLDKAACRIIRLPFENVPTIMQAARRGLCTDTMEDITMAGDLLESFVVQDFTVPHTREINPLNGTPRFLRGVTDRLLKPRPVFKHGDCISCGICAENCPPKVIDMRDKKPYVNLNGCIRCFCCQELCPKKAVAIHRPLLIRLVNKN